MSDSKYTKGPWRVHGGYGICVVPNEPIGVIGVRTIVACRQEWIPAKEQHANARLIAAAPELLEALIEMVEDFSDRFDLESSSTNPGIKHVIAEARHVIKKATGK